jgi:hypothetical protein
VGVHAGTRGGHTNGGSHNDHVTRDQITPSPLFDDPYSSSSAGYFDLQPTNYQLNKLLLHGALEDSLLHQKKLSVYRTGVLHNRIYYTSKALRLLLTKAAEAAEQSRSSSAAAGGGSDRGVGGGSGNYTKDTSLLRKTALKAAVMPATAGEKGSGPVVSRLAARLRMSVSAPLKRALRRMGRKSDDNALGSGSGSLDVTRDKEVVVRLAAARLMSRLAETVEVQLDPRVSHTFVISHF